MELSTNLIVVIILQYTSISNHQVVHLKCIQCFKSVITLLYVNSFSIKPPPKLKKTPVIIPYSGPALLWHQAFKYAWGAGFTDDWG